ncbi:MAG TPA: ATP-binding protein, partial [Bryobacteraceae bacterium]|nr:ATP-binding protein [Bryobacteraceae bacterium]
MDQLVPSEVAVGNSILPNEQRKLAEFSETVTPVARTVLCVDDTESNRYVRSRALRAAGLRVIEAANGMDALSLAIEEQPDLVVLDIGLPDLNGFEVSKRLKSDPRTQAVPVLHVSAIGRMEHDLPQSIEHRGDAYLREPIDPDTLVATARALIRAHEAERNQREAEARARAARASAAEHLARANQQLQTVLNSITDGLMVLDRDWRCTYISEQGARMIGMRTEDLMGNCVWDLFPHAEGTKFHEGYHRAVETGQKVQFEEYYPEPLNLWLECHCYPSAEGLSVYFQDVTGRKKAEDALRASERRYSALFQNRLNAIAHCRTVTGEDGKPIDYEILEVNDAYELVTGIKKADIEGKLATEVFRGIENFSFDYIGTYGKIALEGGELSFEVYFEGLRQWLSIYVYSPKQREFVAIFTDISNRKQAEQALRESEARERARAAELEAIMDAVPVATFVSHDPECRQMVGSRTTYELLRLAPGSNLSKSAPEGQRPTTFKPMKEGREIAPYDLPAQKAASTGRPVRNYDFDVVFEDGTCRNLLGDAVPLFGEDGRPSGAVGAFVDITDLKRAEERLRQSQKLESIGLLAGGIAHDFNNLLTGIMGYASMVLDEVGPGPARRIQEVLGNAERAAGLTRQLLAYSGQGQFISQDLDVSQAVNETADLMQLSIPKSVDLVINVQRRLPVVRMDPSQLQQIIMNLIINAGEAIGQGSPGRITVATSMRDVGKAFVDAIGGEVAPGRYVSIEVSDTGCGIDPGSVSKIFDPFFTTKFTGRGLGLAAVAGIIRTQNGAITVDSSPGRGTTFRVYLRAATTFVQEPEERPDASRLGTVLV